MSNTSFSEQKKKKIETWMVKVFGVAILCDMSGTTLMSAISEKTGISIHSICGYSALFIMAVHFFLSIVAIKYRGRAETLFNRCSPFAWIAWSIAFFTGMLK